MNRQNLKSIPCILSTPPVAGIVVIDLHDFGHLFLNRMIVISFELEKVEFRMFENHLNWKRWSSECLFQLLLFLKSLKRNCSLRFAPDLLFRLSSQEMLMRLLLVRRLVMVLCQRVLIEYWGCC